uniref:X-linked retinitis pigmentosa GTPase regulator-interacting protein 1 n=1 Tax=Geotrypetes seraphini TaxID=260995 RepID=A0A6P8P5W1_GEOSA|nr:X-linked retinitis pigmentosa GTPase regulator-interacting protein 1 [Geotrypetes seraphini]
MKSDQIMKDYNLSICSFLLYTQRQQHALRTSIPGHKVPVASDQLRVNIWNSGSAASKVRGLQHQLTMSLVDETAGDLLVRDTDQKPEVIRVIGDLIHSNHPSHLRRQRSLKRKDIDSRAGQHVIQIPCEDLKDGFLRLREENLLLKENARKQEGTIKRMGVQILRLASKHKWTENGKALRRSPRVPGVEDEIEDLQDQLRALEQQNRNLRNRLTMYKLRQQVQGFACRHCSYGSIQARINSGLRRTKTEGQLLERTRRVIKVREPESRPSPQTAPPQYEYSLTKEQRAEIEQLVQAIQEQPGQVAKVELGLQTSEETDCEEKLSFQHLKQAEAQRMAICENVEMIRLQRLTWEKSVEVSAMKKMFLQLKETYETQLQERHQTLASAHTTLLAQVEGLSAQLQVEQQKVVTLESQLGSMSSLQKSLKEFQEQVEDLEKERDLLKESNELLMKSAMNTEHLHNWKVIEELWQEISCLRKELSSAMEGKRDVLDALEKERGHNEELQQEVNKMQLQLLKHKQEVESPQQKEEAILNHDTTGSSHTEKRHHPNTSKSKILDALGQSGLPSNGTGKEESVEEAAWKGNPVKKLHELEAAHSETILELEKTRNMLILQHKINQDYQGELKAVTLEAEKGQQEHEEKVKEITQLLDRRSTRIEQLQEQLKDIAYGTWPRASLRATNGKEHRDTNTPPLRRGENLFELHLNRAFFTLEALREKMGDPHPATFFTYSLYDYETQCTPVVTGTEPRYDFTSQYAVRGDSSFLHYLQGASARLDLHQALGTDHWLLGSCWLQLHLVLKTQERVYGTATLSGTNGEELGILEYWMRLRFPISQTLYLSQEREKALAYLSTNIESHQESQNRDEGHRERNELLVRISRCQALKSRCPGSPPSPYAIYRFYDFPDHDTLIVPWSRNPQFSDSTTFPVHMTFNLDCYLRLEALWVYVFDDEEPDPGWYLGKVQVPLLPLAYGRNIKGDFLLIAPDGSPNGSIHLSLEWKFLYQCPGWPLLLSVDCTVEKPLETWIEEERSALDMQQRAAVTFPGATTERWRKRAKMAGKENATIDSLSTDSDEVIIAARSQRHTKLQSDQIRIEVASLTFDSQSQVAAAESIQQVYVEYHFQGLPLEETETPFSLRKPRAWEEIHFNYSRVIEVDAEENMERREFLAALLEEGGRLRFTVVSEPLAEQGEEECQDVGYAYLDLGPILCAGKDLAEQTLDILNAPDQDTVIGTLKVSVEAATTLCAIQREKRWPLAPYGPQ